ncbi:MAG: hypothetical protein Q8K75_03645 [Chlamydiales bacterium]|nr:hypothetical protein [Chlamydiales bacterium]
MKSTFFVDAAHEQVKCSIQEAHEGRLVESWKSETIARAAYAADAVASVILSPISIVPAACSATATVLTWGETVDRLYGHTEQLLEALNRIVRAVLGAVLSPNLAFHHQDSNLVGWVIWIMGFPRDEGYVPIGERVTWEQHWRNCPKLLA